MTDGDRATGARGVARLITASLLCLASIAAAGDYDGDGVDDSLDNCPRVANVGQENADSLFPGDACACGDTDHDGDLDVRDVVLMRRFAAGLAAPGLDPARCSVARPASSCDGVDAAIARGWLAGLNGVSFACAAAGLDVDPDANDDGVVNAYDASIVGFCFAEDPRTNCACRRADVDQDDDVDPDDLGFVSAQFGEAGFPIGTSDPVAPEVEVLEPAAGSLVRTSSVTVRVRASEALVAIEIGGVRGIADDAYARVFHAVVPLAEGSNAIEIHATDESCNVGTAALALTLDSTPPVVVIESPADGATTEAAATDVSGTLDDASAVLRVDGAVTPVAAGAWQVLDKPLVHGPNEICALATDPAGNVGSDCIAITRLAVLERIDLKPNGARLIQLDAIKPFRLDGVLSDSTIIDLTSAPGTTYESSNPFVSTIDSIGRATARAGGTTQITARVSGGFSDTSPLTVELAVDLLSLSVAPPEATLRFGGDTIQLAATGGFSDGSTRDLSSGASGTDWSSSAPAVASVSADGLLTALAEGSALVTATNETLADSSSIRVAISSGFGFLRGETLDDSRGLPLDGVTATLVADGSGALTAPLVAASDAHGRFLHGGAEGDALVRLERAGYTAVERLEPIPAGTARTLVDARLTPLDSANTRIAAAAGGTARNAAGALRADFLPAALPADTDVRLTEISPQGLAGRLPLGWSPVLAAELSPRGLAFSSPVLFVGPNRAALARSSDVVAVRYDETAHAWRVIGLGQVTADGREIATEIAASGQVALVVPDDGASAPPSPQSGALLEGVPEVALASGASASGEVTPEVSPASPEARARATLSLEAIGATPSGSFVEGDVLETFHLLAGTVVAPRPFTQDLFVHARPRVGDTGELGAAFPITPSRGFELFELAQGRVTVALVPARSRVGGQLVGPAGAVVDDPASGAIVEIPPGALARETIAELRAVADAAPSVPAALELLAAFELDLVGAPLASAAVVSLPAPSGVGAADQLLVAELLREPDDVPRLRFVALGALAGGRVTTTTSLGPLTLRGVAREGRYLLLRPAAPGGLGFASGVVTAIGGVGAQSGALVTAASSAFADLTGPDGRYVLPLPPGDAIVAANLVASGDGAIAPVSIAAAGALAAADFALAVVGPVVVSISPPAERLSVPVDVSVEVIFSEPVEAATFGATAFVLSGPSGPVAASRRLSPDGRTALLTPDAPLASHTRYEITLGAPLADLSGNPLATFGPSSFTTLDTTFTRDVTGLVEASVVDARRIRVRGGPGVAEAGSAIAVINETTSVIVTEVAASDGSFELLIDATSSDLLTLNVRTAAGTDTEVAVGTIANLDGSFSVGATGGELSVAGPDGPITLDVPPGAFAGATRIAITPLTQAEAEAALAAEGLALPDPVATGAYFGGALRIDAGSALAAQRLDLSVPLPAAVEAAALSAGRALSDVRGTLVRVERSSDTEGVESIGFREIDSLRIIDARLDTNSPPFDGIHGQFTGFYFFFPFPLFFTAYVNGRVLIADDPANPNLQVPSESVVCPDPDPSTAATQACRAGGAIVRAFAPFFTGTPLFYAITDPLGHYSGTAPIASTEVAAIVAKRFDSQQAGTSVQVTHMPVAPMADVTMRRIPPPPDSTPPTLRILASATNVPLGSEITLTVVATDNDARAASIAQLQGSLALSATQVPAGGSGPPPLVTDPLDGRSKSRWIPTVQGFYVVRATGVDASGNSGSFDLGIDIGDFPAPPGVNPPAGDPDDAIPPFVLEVEPAHGSLGVPPGTPIGVHFSEPVQLAVSARASDGRPLYFDLQGPTSLLSAAVVLSPDQTRVELRPADALEAGATYTLTAKTSIRDLNGVQLDQLPISGATREPFRSEFTVLDDGALADVATGLAFSLRASRSSVVAGNTLFFTDRDSMTGNDVLKVYDVSNPAAPALLSEADTGGQARALAVLPRFSYLGLNRLPTFPRPPLLGFAGEPAAEPGSLLVAVVFKRFALETGLDGTFLTFFDVSDPANTIAVGSSQRISFGSIGTRLVVTAGRAYVKLTDAPNPGIAIVDLSIALNKAIVLPPGNVFVAPDGSTAPLPFGSGSIIDSDGSGSSIRDFDGIDSNGDGDFGDPGEQLPDISSNTEVVLGRIATPGDGTDLDVSPDGRFVYVADGWPADVNQNSADTGACLAVGDGPFYGTGGVGAGGALVADRSGGLVIADVNPLIPVPLLDGVGGPGGSLRDGLDDRILSRITLPENGTLTPASRLRFEPALELRERVTEIVNSQPVTSERGATRDVAFVANPADGSISAVDVSNPLCPIRIAVVRMPMVQGAQSQPLEMQRARSLLYVNLTDSHTAVLDLERLVEIDRTGGTDVYVGVSPPLGIDVDANGQDDRIVSVLENLSSGQSAVATGDFGETGHLYAGSRSDERARRYALPRVEIVRFSGTEAELAAFDPSAPGDGVNRPYLEKLAPAKLLLAGRLHDPSALGGAALGDRTDPERVYFVRAVLPSAIGTGGTIEFTLENLNAARAPNPDGGYGFPVSSAGSPAFPNGAAALRLHRQIDDASFAAGIAGQRLSELGTLWVSEPIFLTRDALEQSDLGATTGPKLFAAGHWLRASLAAAGDDANARAMYTPGASADDAQRILARARAEVLTSVPAGQLDSPEPESARSPSLQLGGDAAGGVHMQSGEFTLSATDLAIKGRGFDYAFTRSYESQSHYNGPLGRGWEFEYNARLEQIADTVPASYELTLVDRPGSANDVIARRSDLIVHDGRGRAELYEFLDEGPDPNDPDELLVELGLDQADRVARHYRSPTGFFTKLLKLADGTFLLIERDGTRTRFGANGELVARVDLYGNRLEFLYDSKLRLRVVIDSMGRAIEFGYYKIQGAREEADFDTALDEDDPNGEHAGKIRKQVDFIDREVVYEYDADNKLERVTLPETPEAAPGCPTFTSGRTLEYQYEGQNSTNPRFSFGMNAVIAPREVAGTGTPRIANTFATDGKLGTQRWGGGAGQSSGVAYGGATTTLTDRKGNTTSATHDPLGRATELVESGPGLGAGLTIGKTYNADGLPSVVTLPEGNEIEYVYDETNPRRRSQGNVVAIKRRPGSRPTGGSGAELTTELLNYDFRFNKPREVLDPLQIPTEYVYDDAGSVRFTNHALGVSEERQYNDFGQLEREIDGEGNQTFYDYHAESNPSATVPTDAPATRSLDFSDGGYLAEVIVNQFAGSNSGFGMRPAGSVVGPLFLTTSYGYGDVGVGKSGIGRTGSPTSIIDPRGVETEVEINALNQIFLTRRAERVYGPFPGGFTFGPLHFVESVCYDGNNRVEVREVQHGLAQSDATRFEYEYDLLDHVRFERVQAGGLAGQGIETVYIYDDSQNLEQTIHSEGNVTFHEYDGADRLTKTTRGYGTAAETSESTVYDGNGNPIERLDGFDRATATDYDGYDRPLLTTDRVGSTLSRFYDDGGRLERELYRGTSGGSSGTLSDLRDVRHIYDDLYRERTRRALILGTPDENQTVFEWDRNHRLIAETDDHGHVREHYYDGVGRRNASRDAALNEVVYLYDLGQNVIETIEREQPSGTEFRSRAEYDALSRRTATIGPAPNSNRREYFYDAQDNLIRTVDAEGNEVERGYDLLNRLEVVRERIPSSAPIETFYEYDENRNQTAIVDGENNRTDFRYDESDRLFRTDYPDGTFSQTVFDANSNPQTFTDQNGAVRTNTYDEENRLTGRTVSRASLGDFDAVDETYDWDGLGRMTLAEDEDSRVEIEHDSLDRATLETLHWLGSGPGSGRSAPVARAYDDHGNRLRLDYPSGLQIHYAYDALDRVDTIGRTLLGAQIADYAYDGPARVVERVAGNGVRLGVSYDTDRRPIRYDHALATPAGVARPTSFDLRTAWTPESKRAGEQRVHKGGKLDALYHDAVYRITGLRADALPGSATTLDGLGQLGPSGLVAGAFADPAWERDYAYDLAHNLTAAPLTANAATIPSFADDFGTANSRNQYAALGELGVPRTQSYDDNGNTTALRLELRAAGTPIPSFGSATVDYDYRNQPVRVQLAGTETIYRYDALGRRIAKEATPAAGPTAYARFALDDVREIEERDPSAAPASELVARYVHGVGIDELLAMDRAPAPGGALATRFAHENSLGSIVGLTDSAGVEVEHYRYDAYGSPVIEGADYAPPTVAAITNDGSSLVIDFSEPMREDGLAGAFSVGGAAVTATSIATSTTPPGAPAPVFRSSVRVPGAFAVMAPVTVTPGAAGPIDESGNTMAAAFAGAVPPIGPPVPVPGAAYTGPTLSGVSPAGNPFLFQGRRLDPETGLYYYRARYYAPSIGRFLQADPKGFADGPNVYLAFGADPLNRVDAMGTEDEAKTKPEEKEEKEEKKEGFLAWLGGLFKDKAEEVANEKVDELKEKATEKATEVAEAATGLAVGDMLETVGKAADVIEKAGTLLELKGDVEACDGDPAICAAMASKYLEKIGDAAGLPGQLIIKPMANLPNEAVEAGQKLNTMRAIREREAGLSDAPATAKKEPAPKHFGSTENPEAWAPFYACLDRTGDVVACQKLVPSGGAK